MKAELSVAALLLAGLAMPAMAQSEEPVRRQIVIYGSDPCPAGEGDEIVVCSRRPEAERNRIPQGLREDPPDPAGPSWADRARMLDRISPGGLDSCSPVGPGGSTGCRQQALEDWADERAQEEDEPE
jgi:hypothetical protein